MTEKVTPGNTGNIRRTRTMNSRINQIITHKFTSPKITIIGDLTLNLVITTRLFGIDGQITIIITIIPGIIIPILLITLTMASGSIGRDFEERLNNFYVFEIEIEIGGKKKLTIKFMFF